MAKSARYNFFEKLRDGDEFVHFPRLNAIGFKLIALGLGQVLNGAQSRFEISFGHGFSP